MRVIILAAGQAFQLDGFNKLLIKDPKDGRKIIDKYLEAFKGKNITVVLGYRAINMMHNYPNLHYVFNPDWAVTNNSFSLAHAIDDSPCFVLSCDLFIDPELIRMMDETHADCVLTENLSNRTLTTLNCSLSKNRKIVEIYQGPLKSNHDPAAIGIYKITNPEILKAWKRNCLEHSNLFVGQNLPFNIDFPIYALDKGPYSVDEVNTPLDYIRLIDKTKKA